MHAAVIETARLALRRHRRDDLEACGGDVGDPIVTRHIGGKAVLREEVWARLPALRRGNWSLMGFGYWVIEEKSSGRFCRRGRVRRLQRTIAPSLGGAPEIGWALAAGRTAPPFATEAVGAAIGWGEAHFGAARTGVPDPSRQSASIRVATKCGYRNSRAPTTRTGRRSLPTMSRRWACARCRLRVSRPAGRSSPPSARRRVAPQMILARGDDAHLGVQRDDREIGYRIRHRLAQQPLALAVVRA